MKNSLRGAVILGMIGAAAGTAAVATRPAPAGARAGRDLLGALNQPGGECATNGRTSALFMPGTPDEVVAAVTRAMLKQLEREQGNERYYTGGRWPGSQGDPVTLAYSFPADGLNIPSGIGEPSGPNILHADLTVDFGSATLWKDKIRQAFDQWEAVTGNIYVEVSDDGAGWGASGPITGGSGRGDIRIASHFIDGGGGVIAYNSFPSNGDMVIDSGQTWSAAGDWRAFRNTINHENGHGMGMHHVCSNDSSQLLEPFLNTAINGPQLDDRRAMHGLYGDGLEDNDSSGAAVDLGALGTGTTAFSELSMHNRLDADYFRFSISVAADVDVRATPVGTTYSQAPQSGDGSCPSSQSALNSAAQQDLVITVFNASLLEEGSANDFPAGGVEEIVALALAPGVHYVRITSNNVAFGSGDSQLYDLRLEVLSEGITGDINGDCEVDTADLGGLVGAFGNTGPPGGGLFGDINEDGVVDTADLGEVLSHFGQTCPV